MNPLPVKVFIWCWKTRFLFHRKTHNRQDYNNLMKWIMCGRVVNWVLIAGMIMLASCQQVIVQDISEQEEITPVLIHKTFTASFVRTKTYRDNNQKCGFSQGDVIRYFGNVSKDIRSITITDTGESVTLDLLLSPNDTEVTAIYGGIDIDNQPEYFFQIIISEDKIPICDGRFSSSQIAVSHVEANEGQLFFYNVTSLLKFSLYRDDVKRVVFYSNDGTFIQSNALDVFFNSGIPDAYHHYDSAFSFIPLSIDGAGEYYIPLMPQIIRGGFTFEFYNEKDEYLGSVRSNKSLSVGNNEIINLGELDSRFDNAEMLYQFDDGENNRIIYSSVSGSVMSVQRNRDTDNPKFAYTTTVFNKNIGTDQMIRVHSDEDGVVRAIETQQANYELKYSESGDSFVVEKTYRDVTGGDIKKFQSEVFLNPNYNKDPLPPDYTQYDGLLPSQVLSCYSIISPILSCLSIFGTKGWFDATVLIASLGNATSPFGNPTLGKAIAIIGTAGAIGGILLASSSVGLAFAAAAMFIQISDVFNSSMLEKQDQMVQILYGDAVPVTLGYEVLSENSVRISCAVSEYAPARIGIILGDSWIINHRTNCQKRSVDILPGQTEYTITFSGLIPGKKYRYRAYLTNDDESIIDYCKYASDIYEFYLYKEADDLGLSASWATVNLGASAPWETGTLFLLSEAERAAENISGWRLPTREECEELSTMLHYDKMHDVNGWMADNSLFFPLTLGSYGYYMTSSGHPTYGKSTVYVWYMTTQGIGVNWSATPVAVRLVRE